MNLSEASLTTSPAHMCITLFSGISAVVHGGIFFVLLGLPILFYWMCIASAKGLIKQSSITQDEQNGALCLPCCNCCLIMFLGIGMLAYFGFTIFTLISVFQCTEMYSIAIGVFVAFILPVNLAVFIGTKVVLVIMLIDSCKLCTILCCNYK